MKLPVRSLILSLVLSVLSMPQVSFAGDEDRTLLWGDTHLHTSYSFDAFLNGNMSADPETAYRYAKGEPVIHPYHRARVQINTPLDFLVVSDHAEFLGGIRDIYLTGIQDPDPGLIEQLVYWYREREIRSAINEGSGAEFFRNLLPVSQDPIIAAAAWRETVGTAIPGADVSGRRAWHAIADAADRHNNPGTFTALIGWEWSSTPGGANLHRIVLTSADAEQAKAISPFRSIDSPFPEDLWDWMEQTGSSSGMDLLAIPHNSNISKGQMFSEKTLKGDDMTLAYAQKRRIHEPVTEITQIKGDSETHPSLSPDDEFADFESYPFYIQQQPESYRPDAGDFIRTALKTGLAIEARLGVNPYSFGVIGSTDSHTGLSSAEEPNFWGKMAKDSIPENKQAHAIAGGSTGWTMSASGLAAVWSEANSRESILKAFRRKEVYATTGSRIRVRVFAGFDFTGEDLVSPDQVARGYARGVPMGGVLHTPDDSMSSPSFMIEAMRDPRTANLDRVQMVKGWISADGRTLEKVFDVAWSDNRSPREDGTLPALPVTVDPRTGQTSDETGAAHLTALWIDPQFDRERSAFYYVRVLEIPTARHALLDAVALGIDEPTEGPSTIQERAYTSPIWYQP